MKTITEKDIKKAWEEIKPYMNDVMEVRRIFFSHFLKSDRVPAELVQMFRKIASLIYRKDNKGYRGIIKEVRDRVELYSDIDGYVEVREFMVHPAGKTDFYDKENRKGYEKKSGIGEWLRSEKYTTFEDIIDEYRRKRTIIRWDYDFIPPTERCEGGKDIIDNDGNNTKKYGMDNGRKSQKQFEVHVHIETTYKRLFDYMDTYPAGIKTFFRYNPKKSVSGVTVYEIQSLKTSMKKIAFLESFDAWDKMNK